MNDQSTSILLTEDNPTNLFYLETLIKKHLPAIKLLIAHNGKEAIEIYQQHLPQIILLDLHMPVMNGDIAAAKIRHHAKSLGRKPIIIGLTASFPSSSNEVFKQNVDSWLMKPISKEQLKTVLGKHLESIDHFQAKKSDLSGLPHCDFEELRISLGNDTALIAEVLHYALNYLQDFPAKITVPIELGDWPQIVKLAHELRGAALNARFPRIAHFAYLIENQATPDQTIVLQQLEQIREETSTLIPLLRSYADQACL